MKPITFHPEAEQEVDSAAAYYESRREGLGGEFRAEVERVTGLIEKNPQLFPPHTTPGIRKCVLRRFPYTLFYLELEEAVSVLAMAHQKRKPGYWEDRMPG